MAEKVNRSPHFHGRTPQDRTFDPTKKAPEAPAAANAPAPAKATPAPANAPAPAKATPAPANAPAKKEK